MNGIFLVGVYCFGIVFIKNGNSKCFVIFVYKKFFVIYIKFNKFYDFVEKYFLNKIKIYVYLFYYSF